MFEWIKRKIHTSWFKVQHLTATEIFISPHDDYGLFIKIKCSQGEEVNIRFNPKTTRKFCDEILKNIKPWGYNEK